ncbi:hypothetical protein ABTK08_20455, partial [Acinetobacter baumannii]
QSGAVSAPTAAAASPTAPSTDEPKNRLPATFADLSDALDTAREVALAEQLRVAARVVRYAAPEIVLSSLKPMPATLPRDLADVMRRL